MKAWYATLLLFFIFPYTQTYAQESKFSKKNTAFVELGGTAGIYALKFDRILFQKGSWALAGGIGLTLSNVPFDDEERLEFTPRVPIELNLLYGKNRHHLEVGIGSNLYLSSNQSGTFIFPRIGYRYQKSEGGFFFRTSFTPIVDLGEPLIVPWGSIGVGFSF